MGAFGVRYDKEKMNDVIDILCIIREYDYITYPPEDDTKVKAILDSLQMLVDKWENMHNDNISY